MFQFFKELVPPKCTVWDCGTGNGQAAYGLAKCFQHVIGTDRSLEQLKLAKRRENILYVCSPAEKTPIPSNTIDFITIAQALHWFDLPLFYEEVIRVAREEAYLAAWCYSLCQITPQIDRIVAHLYEQILGEQYWPKERIYIEEEYKTIPFPFKRIESPAFVIRKKMNLYDFLGYLNTWSAVKEYERREGKNPLGIILNDLQSAWDRIDKKLDTLWPIHMLVGKV
ncbi:class I SAM-dependent methyltransferase [Legionella adelaidensis]|nr:class I SAM-dependent methyltransferase [Legionella adelaidensis]